MRHWWLGLVGVLLPGPAHAAAWLQCSQPELKDPACATLAVNHTPLYFTASCQECSGGGSDIKCTPGEKVTAQTLSIETTADHKPIAGGFSQQGTCDLQVPLWKFVGTLTKGVTYDVVLAVTGHPRTLLLTFTAGSSTPGGDGASNDGGGILDGGIGDGASGDGASGDGTGHHGSDEDGCGCRLARRPAAPGVAGLALVLLLLAGPVRARRHR